jgi:hypothetical protein
MEKDISVETETAVMKRLIMSRIPDFPGISELAITSGNTSRGSLIFRS